MFYYQTKMSNLYLDFILKNDILIYDLTGSV